MEFSETYYSFNLCHQVGNSTSSTIDVTKWTSSDRMYWYQWMWFFPILLGVQMLLRYFDVKGKIHCMSTLFGPVVRIIDFLQGPEMEDVEGKQNNSFNSIPTLE